jgi:hypothetical protein
VADERIDIVEAPVRLKKGSGNSNGILAGGQLISPVEFNKF